MMDGLYEFRMLTKAALRSGVLLKQGALLFGRAGDWITFGIIGSDQVGPVAHLVIWEAELAGDAPIDERPGTYIRLRGLVSRGGARLFMECPNGDGVELAMDLSLFRAPVSRSAYG